MRHITRAILLTGLLASALVVADDDGLALSYMQQDADTKVAENLSAMQGWAEGEYQEHAGEGLFKTYPAEGRLLNEMAAVSRELQAKAEAAKQAGESDKARAYYYAAEAASQYAARMPHMFENRLKESKP